MLQSLKTTHYRALSRIAMRAFWLGMLLAHLPSCLAAWGLVGGGMPQPLRGTVLGLSVLLFVLKLIDVPWLRLPADRRVWLAVAVGVALLHAGVVPDAIGPLWNDASGQSACLISVLIVLGAGLSRRCHLIFTCRIRALRRQARESLHRIREILRDAFLPTRDLLLACAACGNRAPPA